MRPRRLRRPVSVSVGEFDRRMAELAASPDGFVPRSDGYQTRFTVGGVEVGRLTNQGNAGTVYEVEDAATTT